MSINKVVNSVIQIPRDFRNLGNVSIYSLLKASGYFQHHNQVSEDIIRKELNRYPQYIDEWVTYSADKRCSEGWYLKQNGKTGYVVGYLSSTAGDTQQMRYSNPADACAAFIKREIEDMRQ